MILQIIPSNIDSLFVGLVLAALILSLWAAVSDYLRSGPARDRAGRYKQKNVHQILPILRIIVMLILIYLGTEWLFG